VYGGEPGFPEESMGKNPQRSSMEETAHSVIPRRTDPSMSIALGLGHLIVMLSVAPALAQRERAQLWCEQGGQTVTPMDCVKPPECRSPTSCTVTVV